jgi:hypothetical protein
MIIFLRRKLAGKGADDHFPRIMLPDPEPLLFSDLAALKQIISEPGGSESTTQPKLRIALVPVLRVAERRVFFGGNFKLISLQISSLQNSLGAGEKVLKAFPCGMCEMSFSQKWLLKRHWRTHTRERPFRLVALLG